ncbi:MAG: DUF1326 domain-containing protein [Microthrixaceae bacterium]
MTLQLSGNVLIACNCDWGCPCNFNAPPTHGDCEGGWVWSIDDGEVDGVDVAGRAVAVFADWPGAIHDGGGQASVYLDDGADANQEEALTRLVRGEVGGPWSIFINTYELDGPYRARFDVDIADHNSTATVDGVAELELQTIRNPVSGAEAHAEVVLPEGLILERAGMATSKVFRVHGGVAYDHSGKYAAFGPFSYSG